MHKAIIDKLKLTPTFHYEMWGDEGEQVPVYEYKDGLFAMDAKALGFKTKLIVIFNCGSKYNAWVLISPAMLNDTLYFNSTLEKFKKQLYEDFRNTNY